jgi:hypothetical protein
VQPREPLDDLANLAHQVAVGFDEHGDERDDVALQRRDDARVLEEPRVRIFRPRALARAGPLDARVDEGVRGKQLLAATATATTAATATATATAIAASATARATTAAIAASATAIAASATARATTAATATATAIAAAGEFALALVFLQ